MFTFLLNRARRTWKRWSRTWRRRRPASRRRCPTSRGRARWLRRGPPSRKCPTKKIIWKKSISWRGPINSSSRSWRESYHRRNKSSSTKAGVLNKRAACGPPDVFVRPASTSKYCKLYFELWFKALFSSFCGQRRHFFSLCSQLIFFKMCPLHRFEFETPELKNVLGKKLDPWTHKTRKTIFKMKMFTPQLMQQKACLFFIK